MTVVYLMVGLIVVAVVGMTVLALRDLPRKAHR
jgi:hypothetical protein